MMYESYEIGCADIVLLYIYTLCCGGRDPYCTGGVRRRCYITYIWRKGPVWHGRSAKTVLYISYWEEGTRIARAECEDGAMIYM